MTSQSLSPGRIKPNETVNSVRVSGAEQSSEYIFSTVMCTLATQVLDYSAVAAQSRDVVKFDLASAHFHRLPNFGWNERRRSPRRDMRINVDAQFSGTRTCVLPDQSTYFQSSDLNRMTHEQSMW
jgi:hypothetical protein